MCQLARGHFPIWNPYWGIGHPVEAWGTIPLDLYTPLELLFGPRYHAYQSLQLTAIVAAALFALYRLGATPLLAAAGAMLFVLSPLTSYFFFYFVVGHSFIASILLLAFTVGWLESRHLMYLLLILWTTALGMLGTKPEFWFFQTAYVAFVTVAGALLYERRLPAAARLAAAPLLFMALGIAAQAWQLNIILRIFGESGRAVESGLQSLASPAMYRSLLLSLGESVFVKLVAIAALLFLATRLRSRWSVPLAGAAVIVATLFAVQDRIVYAPAPALPNGTLDAWSRTTNSLNAPDHFTYRQDGFGPGVQEADGRSGRAAVLYRSSVGNSMLRYGVPDVGRYRGRHVRMSFWVRSDRRFDTVQADLQDGVSAPIVVTVQTRPRWQRQELRSG